MKYILTCTLILFSCLSEARTIRIGVIDTGYNVKFNSFKHCKDQDRDFNGDGMNDTFGHGQNINHIIAKDLEYTDYCIVNIKVFSANVAFSPNKYLKALKYMDKLPKFDIINMSIGGNQRFDGERIILKRILRKGTIVVVSAGNDRLNLDKGCSVYPACNDPKLTIVGCKDNEGKICRFSNYGKVVDYWTNGMNVSAGGITMSGTSQSAALYTNYLIKQRSKK